MQRTRVQTSSNFFFNLWNCSSSHFLQVYINHKIYFLRPSHSYKWTWLSSDQSELVSRQVHPPQANQTSLNTKNCGEFYAILFHTSLSHSQMSVVKRRSDANPTPSKVKELLGDVTRVLQQDNNHKIPFLPLTDSVERGIYYGT